MIILLQTNKIGSIWFAAVLSKQLPGMPLKNIRFFRETKI